MLWTTVSVRAVGMEGATWRLPCVLACDARLGHKLLHAPGEAHLNFDKVRPAFAPLLDMTDIQLAGTLG